MTVIVSGGRQLATRAEIRAVDPVDHARQQAVNVLRSPAFRNALMGPEGAQIREAIIDYYHFVEDRNWNDLSLDPHQYVYGQDFTPQQRKLTLARIRNIARSNPVAKQTLRLICTYTFGNGLQIKSLQAKNRRFVRPVIMRFWADPYNQRSFASVQAQYQRCSDLIRDGDLFFVARVNEENGAVRFGHLDATFVEDIICDPDDINVPRWYKIRRVKADYNFREGVYDVDANTVGVYNFAYMRDWKYTPMDGDDSPPPDLIDNSGLIFHQPINQEGKFGVPDLYASMDWLSAHKGYMEDRASYTKALHTIAWKVTRRDTPTGIAAAAAATRSTMAASPLGGWDEHPVVAAGSTLYQNDGSNREPVRFDSGADNAVHDAENLLQMAVIGMGIVGTHYVGSTQAHRLATVTQMELPMLKYFQWQQQLWKNIYHQMLQFAIDKAVEAGVIPGDRSIVDEEGHYFTGLGQYDESGDDDSVTVSGSAVIDRTVQVEFPAILIKDLAGVVNAVRNMIDVLPLTVESRKLVASIAFSALGVEDVEDAVRRCFPEGDSAVLLPANSTRNSIVRVLPQSDEQLEDSDNSEDQPAGDLAEPAWTPPAPTGDDADSAPSGGNEE